MVESCGDPPPPRRWYTCSNCKTMFQASRPAKFCSAKCRAEHWREAPGVPAAVQSVSARADGSVCVVVRVLAAHRERAMALTPRDGIALVRAQAMEWLSDDELREFVRKTGYFCNNIGRAHMAIMRSAARGWIAV